MQAKVLDKKTDRLPALLVGSKIPWLGLHEKGGTVSGNLLIPLLPGRIRSDAGQGAGQEDRSPAGLAGRQQDPLAGSARKRRNGLRQSADPTASWTDQI